MKKIGILAFYLNVGNLAPEDVEQWVQDCINEIDPQLDNMQDENNPIHHWERLFIPIRAGQTRIQVIRNEERDLTDIELSDLKRKLEEFEKSKTEISLKNKINDLEVKISELYSKLTKKSFWSWLK